MTLLKSKLGSNFSLIRNIFFLGLTQLINFASPLLITPLLLRTIGVEKFGIVILAQTVMNFTIILTEYGFNLTSTQAVSVNRNDTPYLNRLYKEVITTRFFLVIVGFCIICILSFIVPIFERYRALFLFSYTIVVGRSLLPIWFFTGIEQMQIMTYFNIVAKIISYFLIFIFIHQINDYNYINLLWGIGEIIVGITGVLFLRQRYKISTQLVLIPHVIYGQLREGWAIFLTNSLNAFYMNSGLLILSLFATEQLLGIYAVAEKIMLLGKQLFGVIAQAAYPHACRLATESRHVFSRFLKIEFYSCFLLFSIIGFVFLLFSDPIIYFFIGRAEPQASAILKYLSFVPLIVSLNLPAYHTLIINRFKNSYLLIIGLGSIINVMVNFLLVPTYLVGGTVISIFATELFVTLSFHLILYYKYPTNRMHYL